MAQIVNDKMLELYNALSLPYITSLSNIFYEGCTVLDLIAKKRIAELQKKDLLKDPKTNIFPTYSGYEQQIFISNDRIATSQAVQDGYFIEDGDEIETIEKDTGIVGKFYPANIGFAMRMTDTEKQMLEDFMQARKGLAIEENIKGKWNAYIEDVKFSVARSWYRGLGGDTIDSAINAVNPFGLSTASWNWGTTTGKPNKRQLEGFYSYVVNPRVVNYGNISSTTYAFWKPKVYDFSVATGASNLTNAAGLTAATVPFGYTYSNIDAETELMSATNSSTANVPIIIDIIERTLQNMQQYRKKPQVMLCRREVYQLIIRAKESKAYNTGFQDQKLQTLMDAGYPEHTLIGNVPVIPDDTVYEDQNGTRTYACPNNCIFLVNLDSIKLMNHKSKNWKQNGWEKIQGRYGVYHNYVEATILSYTTSRHLQGVILLSALYTD